MTTHPLAPARAKDDAAGGAPAAGLVVVGLLALEVLLGWASLAAAPNGASISPYWPNAGVSVLALCVAAPRWRPLVVAAILPVSVMANLAGGRALDTSLGLGPVNAVEAAVVFAVLSWHRPQPVLRRLGDFVRLLLAAAAGSAVGALLAGAVLSQLSDAEFGIARGVFTSHAAALLIIPPLAMRLPRPLRQAGTAEAVAQWGLLLATVVLVFSPGQSLAMAFLPFPLLVWGGLRLCPREVLAQLMVFATIAAALTTAGHGPFAATVGIVDHPPELSGTLLTANLVAAALVVMPLSLIATEQQHTLDRLRESYETISSILASTTGTAIMGTGLDGRIEFFNVGAERLTGYRTAEVVDSASLAVTPRHAARPEVRVASDAGPDAQALAAQVEPYLSGTQGHFTTDWDFVCKAGDVRTVSVAITRRHDDLGEPIGYLGVAEDVTERRRQEAMVEAALETEKQIVERLAKVDQTKNDFMATVSHELRTPITSIIGYSQLVLSDDSGSLPAMHHQIVGRIERNGRRLMGLIEDMLTMSQVEVGDFRFHKTPIDLREPVRMAVESAQSLLAMNRLKLEERLGDEPVTVLGDVDKLERVFANLLSNAAKFSHPEGTVTVRLDRDGCEAVFTVADSGVGISVEDQAHLFDRFFRGADAHAMAIQGAGLGLSIANSIVAGHEGRIEVASELGRGSTFVVRMPLLGEERGG